MQTNLSLQPTGAVQGTAGQQTAAAAQQSPVQRAGPQRPVPGAAQLTGAVGLVQGTAGQQTAAAAQQSPVQRAGPQGPTAGSSAVVGGPKAPIPAFVNGIWPVIDPHKLTINILHFVH